MFISVLPFLSPPVASLSLPPNWEEFWISAIKHKLYLLIEEAHPQNYFHKKTVLKSSCTSVLAGRSALCKAAAAASCWEGQIHFAESTRSLHTACKEQHRIMDRHRTAFETPPCKSKASFHSNQPFLHFTK